MTGKKDQLEFFNYPSQRNSLRKKYLKFDDVKSSIIKCDVKKKICLDCQEILHPGQTIAHIYEYATHRFSAFLCLKCFAIFKKNEVEL